MNKINLSKSKYIVTATLPYVNSIPHVGFAFEILLADTLSRFLRINGKTVRFITGTDENSFKVFIKSQEANIPIQEFVNLHSQSFADLKQTLHLSTDIFYRTSKKEHSIGVNKFINSIDQSLLYKKNFESYYCQLCESFVGNSPTNTICQYHRIPYKYISEKDVFLKINKLKEHVLKLYLNRVIDILPEQAFYETIKLLNEYDDFNITRTKEFDWGVNYDGDKKYIIYSFFEALISYISALGYWKDDTNNDFAQIWNDQDTGIIQICGRDILKFHSVYWPIMLTAAGIHKYPNQIIVHSFVNCNGEKISKSKNNIISVDELLREYKSDDLRLYLLSHDLFHDFEFSWYNLKQIQKRRVSIKKLLNLLIKRNLITDEYLLERGVESKIFTRCSRFIINYDFKGAIDFLFNSTASINKKLIDGEFNTYEIGGFINLLGIFAPETLDTITKDIKKRI